MDSRYKIREARPDEDVAVGDVLAHNYKGASAEEMEGHRRSWRLSLSGVARRRRAEGSGTGTAILVAEDTATGALVGAATVNPAGDDWVHRILEPVPAGPAKVFPHRVAEIVDIVVVPEHRRHGIATELMNEAVEHAIRFGFWVALWFFPKDAPDAVGFHETLTPFITKPDQDLYFAEPGNDFGVGRPTSTQPVRAAAAPLNHSVQIGWDETTGSLAIGLWPDFPAWNPEPYKGAGCTEKTGPTRGTRPAPAPPMGLVAGPVFLGANRGSSSAGRPAVSTFGQVLQEPDTPGMPVQRKGKRR